MGIRHIKLFHLVLAGLFLALALVLPFITGQIPEIGKKLCPMHLPVLLCGFFCGPFLGAAVGLMAPLLRSLLFGAPVLYPSGISMCLELCTYGLLSGLLYRKLPQKPGYVYLTLLISMICGRLVMGGANVILYSLKGNTYGMTAFLAGAILNAVPGIIVQILLVPALVLTLRKIKVNRG